MSSVQALTATWCQQSFLGSCGHLLRQSLIYWIFFNFYESTHKSLFTTIDSSQSLCPTILRVHWIALNTQWSMIGLSHQSRSLQLSGLKVHPTSLRQLLRQYIFSVFPVHYESSKKVAKSLNLADRSPQSQIKSPTKSIELASHLPALYGGVLTTGEKS